MTAYLSVNSLCNRVNVELMYDCLNQLLPILITIISIRSFIGVVMLLRFSIQLILMCINIIQQYASEADLSQWLNELNEAVLHGYCILSH